METVTLSERKMVVIRKSDKQKVLNRWYFPGEGVETNPILINDNPYGSSIWTGRVFKSRPAILMGLQSQSFGCPELRF